MPPEGLSIALVVLVISWLATADKARASALPEGVDLELRDPQGAGEGEGDGGAANPAQSPSYNNGLYTPWTGDGAAAAAPAPVTTQKAAVTPAAAPSSSTAVRATPSATTAKAFPASSSSAASATSPSTPAATPAASSSASLSASASSPSSSSSPYTSWVDAPPTPTSWRLDMTLSSRPPYTATLSPPLSSASGSSGSALGSSAQQGGIQFKPVYLVPVVGLVLCVFGYFLGRCLWRRRKRAREAGSVYTAEADLGWADDRSSTRTAVGEAAYPGEEKVETAAGEEEGLRGWKEYAATPERAYAHVRAQSDGQGRAVRHLHTLSYSSTDIFGEETPLPERTQAVGWGYGYGYTPSTADPGYWNPQADNSYAPGAGRRGYAQVPSTPSKPRQKSQRSAGASLYRTASRLGSSVVSAMGAVGAAVPVVRRPSWFRPPQEHASPARLYGPRVAPVRQWGHPQALETPMSMGTTGDDDPAEYAYPEEKEQEERVRGLLFARQRPVSAHLPASLDSAPAAGVFPAELSATEQGYPNPFPPPPAHPQLSLDTSLAPSATSFYAPTPLTAHSGMSSPSVYSLASPPPAPVRALGGRLGRGRTLRVCDRMVRGMGGIDEEPMVDGGEGEGEGVPVSAFAGRRR